VLLQAPAEEVEAIREALINPAWDLYLGRKNCIPTEFIYQGCFDSSEEAAEAGAALAAEKRRVFALRVLQGEYAGEVLTLNDVPLQFGPHKKYRDRQVTVQKRED